MTEEQLRAFPRFRSLPVYDESDEQSHALSTGRGEVRECTTVAQVEECLANPNLAPRGAVRTGVSGRWVVVVYFGETT